MPSSREKLLIVDVAALGWDLLASRDRTRLAGLQFAPMETAFPAVTCTAQASFRTAAVPGEHGMVANGRYWPELAKVMFWEQSAGLVTGERIWSSARRAGRSVGLLFWQQSLGEQADLVLSPAPIHKHHGGMIMDCYSRPAELYPRLRERLGTFKLHRYWGPLARPGVGDWIARATAEVMADPAPDVLLTYLPTLDYDLQRHGPAGRQAEASLAALAEQLTLLVDAAEPLGYDLAVFGDYAIAPCAGAAELPNLALRRAGLLAVREVRGMLYPDLYTSRAVAMVDHEIAHVFVRDEADLADTRRTLERLPGVGAVLDRAAQRELGCDHPTGGELLAIAAEGRWLAYPWWQGRRQRPDYATHIDIHNKPGFDPCELFFGWPPPSVSVDTSRIGGTHGRAGAARRVATARTFELPGEPADLLSLAGMIRDRLGGEPSSPDERSME